MTLRIQGLHIIRRLVDVHISRSNGVRASEPPTREVKDVTWIASWIALGCSNTKSNLSLGR